MQLRRSRTWAIAIATIGLVMLSVSKRAAADIEVYVTDGAGNQVAFDLGAGNNTGGATPIFTIDGYSTQINTIVTSYPGNPGNFGTISTTIDILGAVTSPVSLTTTVMLVSSFTGTSGTPGTTGSPGSGSLTDPLLAWTAPSTTPVHVSSATSFTTNTPVTSGLATTTTYYNSGPAATFTAGLVPGVQPVSSQNYTNTSGNSGPNVLTGTNAGTYSLSQRIVLTGLNSGAEGFNYGGTSSVSAVPEPSTMAIAGLGALGLIGYGLRRRKALGA